MKWAVAALAAVALIAVALAVPTTYVVERSRVVDAAPAVVASQLDDLQRMDAWEPVHERLPGSSSFEGPPRGPGATWRWKTTRGETRWLRVESETPEQIVYRSDASNVTRTASLQPDGARTRVTLVQTITLRGVYKLAPLYESPEELVGPLLDSELSALATAAR